MGCNCGKAKQQFKDIVKQVQATIQPQLLCQDQKELGLGG